MPDFDGPAAWDDFSRPAAKPKKSTNGPRRQAPPKKQGGRLFRRIIIGLLWAALGCLLFGLVAIFGLYAYFAQDLPTTAGLKEYRPKTVTYFYSDDGRTIGEYYHERRFVKPLSEIPEMVRNAFIAAEDGNFYKHHGVNFKAIIRAAWANFKSGENTQGASTITQQVVRSFLLTPEKTITRKIREAILAYRIEGNLEKDEILFLYLNQIYLGRGAYGVEAAARTYFDKGVAQLSLAEAAMIAGVTQSPETKNPIMNPERARERLFYSLNRMEQMGFITHEEAEAARSEVLSVRAEWINPNTTVAPYFTEEVRRMLVARYGEDRLYNDGFKVYTTVNIDDQRAADLAVNQGLWEYSRRRGWKGPVKHLELDEEIAAYVREAEKKLPPEGLKPGVPYEAVIMAVDAKNSALSVKVGPFLGHIEKKNLAWALAKGAASKLFKRGDVVSVRVLSEAPTAGAKPAETVDSADALAAVISGQGVEESFPMSLEGQTDLQAALLSMDLANGDVKAMVGGRDFNQSQFNRATQSRRQPGSSFKPIVYTAAMDNGFTPGSVMVDGPFVVDDRGSNKRWKPVNSDLKFKGPMTLYNALVQSRNLISIKLLHRIGLPALKATALDMGITDPLPDSLTLALGSHGIPMPQLLEAYTSFPNGGRRVEMRYITRVEDRDGNIIARFEPRFVQAISPGTACVMTSMLRGVVEQGTAKVVKPLKRPVGGKTGTTNDYSDAWFVGFTPELATAVWVGTDTPRPRAVGEVGGTVAAPMFLYYMREALKDLPAKDFSPPPANEAVMEPGGAFGICYKVGTIGQGFSEVVMDENAAEDDFLRRDMEEGGGYFEDGDAVMPAFPDDGYDPRNF